MMIIKPIDFASLIGFLLVLFLFLSACGQNQTPMETLTTFTPPEKGNPKFDSQLNQLVQAQAKGEATAFAQKMNITLSNGHVRVVIECRTGQIFFIKFAIFLLTINILLIII